MAARQGFERKHVFIDRRLQGRYMLTFLVPMLVMLGFMVFTLWFASQSMVKSTLRIMREDIDTQIAVALQDKAEPGVEVYEGILDDVGDYVRTFATNERYRRVLLSTVLWTFGLGVFILILQIVWLTIYFSHKVAGPIYRLEKVCSRLIDGDYKQDVYLRKGDELQNLAGLLAKVVEKTRARFLALRDAPDDDARREAASELEL